MDVISGIITMNFSSLPPAVGQIKAGKLKALAVTGEKRVSSLPDVPTLKEQGVDVAVTGWHGLFAPPKTPDAILDRVDKDTKQAMKDPEVAPARWPRTGWSCRPTARAPSSPSTSPTSTPSGARS